MFCKAFVITAITGWLFYQRIWSFLIVCPFGLWILNNFAKEKEEQKKLEFLIQFKEMTECASAALNVGYSVENALKEAEKELKILYPEKSLIGTEMELIIRKIRLQIPTEMILEEFARRVELEDVRNFASVFTAAKRSGGDMIVIIQNTVMQIAEKIDVKREIDIILASKKYEFRIMCVIPYAMIMYMQLSFSSFMEVLYGNAIGIGVMTICLGIYMGAYVIGTRLIKIEI